MRTMRSPLTEGFGASALGWACLILSVLTNAVAASSSVVSLTVDNMKEMTDKKAVFIKFYAPWCGHCKKLAPDWEKLATEWQGSDTGLIAEVDCTDPDAEHLCDEYGVEGYPTLIYGDAYSPELYEGERDYESLAAFAKEHLNIIPCNLQNLPACSPETQAVIQKFRDTSREELLKLETAIDAEINQAEDDYEKAMDELNDQYEKLVNVYNSKLTQIRDEKHYKWLQMVLAESDPLMEDMLDDLEGEDYGDEL